MQTPPSELVENLWKLRNVLNSMGNYFSSYHRKLGFWRHKNDTICYHNSINKNRKNLKFGLSFYSAEKLHKKLHETTYFEIYPPINWTSSLVHQNILALIDAQNVIIQKYISWLIIERGDFTSRVISRIPDIMGCSLTWSQKT